MQHGANRGLAIQHKRACWAVVDIGNSTNCLRNNRFWRPTTIGIADAHINLAPHIRLGQHVICGCRGGNLNPVAQPLVAERAQGIRVFDCAGIHADRLALLQRSGNNWGAGGCCIFGACVDGDG